MVLNDLQLILLIFLAFYVAYLKNLFQPNPPEPNTPESSTCIQTNVQPVASGNNNFTDAFYQVLLTQISGNLVFSPFSVSSAMGMVYAGAGGQTAMQIQQGMRFPPDVALYSGYKCILDSLMSNENITIEIANRIYVQQGFTLNPAYLSRLNNSFNAQAEQLNFGESAAAVATINNWVANVTRDKIDNLLMENDVGPDTKLVLVNAIYFKGLWAMQFDPNNTQQLPFYGSDKQNTSVDIMNIQGDFDFVDLTELDARAVALNYTGNRYCLIVILPNDLYGLPDLETKLKNYDLASIQSKMNKIKVDVSLPRFTLESRIPLTDDLKALGMTTMFDDSADFSYISDPANPTSLKVSNAIQQAIIEVNEEGSEAAAATAITIILTSAIIEDTPIIFDANHGFFAFIFDNEEQVVLFGVRKVN